MKARIIDVEICKEHFNYDDEGNLYWKKLFSDNCRNGKAKVGEIAGNFHRTSGYYIVRLGGKRYQTHRILYQMYNNITLSSDQRIDHFDLNRTNNRKDNLRICTDSENNMNRIVQKNNKTTGCKNIYIKKCGIYEYYCITIIKNKKRVFNKQYSITTPIEKLRTLRDNLLKEIHGEFHNLG